MTVTFSPEQILCYGGLVALVVGALLLICFFVQLGKAGEVPLWLKVCGWTGLVTVVMGGISVYSWALIRDDRIFTEKLATFPVDWQEFHANLSQMRAPSLMEEAVARFAKSEPKQITPEQYHILVAGPRWSSTYQRDRAFNNSCIRKCVSLSFVGDLE